MAEQTYANHAHRPRLWWCAWLGAVASLALSVYLAIRRPSLETTTLMILAVTVVLAVTLMRTFALRLQDRIIRLEMQVRLTRLGYAQYASQLSLPQLIAMRFASDLEMPDLLARAVAEKLTPDQIKRAVSNWQGDHLRT